MILDPKSVFTHSAERRPRCRRTASLIRLLSISLGASAVMLAQTTKYLSDMTPVYEVNGWGPAERDRANGEKAPGDGGPLTLHGKVYAKGLGVHANSELRYRLNGACSTFTTDIGIDDAMSYRGAVIFQVWADGVKLYDSSHMYGFSGTQSVHVNVAGKNELALVVGDAGNGIGSDWGDWADAKVTCDAQTSLTPSTPIVVSGQSNVTIRGVKIQNSSGPCITVRPGSTNIRIEDSELGPCLGGIAIDSARNVVVNNVYIHDSGTAGNGIDIVFSDNVTISNNRIERVRTGIYALSSTLIKVDKNRFLNALGPYPRGAFVQFNQVKGGGNLINCNVGENIPGESNTIEAINLYMSDGLSADPILVTNNKIRGAAPNYYTGAILLGDGGGSYQVARNNVAVNSGAHGVSVAGGHDLVIADNTIYSPQQSYTNAGITVWNQYAPACYKVTIQNNRVNWTNRNGQLTPFWDAGNCGPISGINTNQWNVPLSAAAFDVPIPACAP
jgi:parallel beta-helix repeat protein